MHIGIYAREVQAGDIVEVYEGQRITVAEVREDIGSMGYRRIQLWADGGLQWIGAETTTVRLVFRPLPAAAIPQRVREALFREFRELGVLEDHVGRGDMQSTFNLLATYLASARPRTEVPS